VDPTRLEQIAAQGQSVWYDHLRRAMLDSGGLEAVLGAGARGALSDSETLRRAILAGTDYDQAIARLAQAGHPDRQIAQQLVVEDARSAADRLLPVYEETHGLDGYLSLWLDPELADDRRAILSEATRLTQAVQRPNLMLEIPATPPGLAALRALVAQGVSVHATLVFSVEAYQEAAEAYIQGMAELAESGADLSRAASLVGIHLSDLDRKVDRMLAGLGADELQAALLRGRSAVALARAVQAHRREFYRRSEWTRLAQAGARQQRLLFRGLLPLDPSLPDDYYIGALVGADSVSAPGPEAFEVMRRPGSIGPSLEGGLEGTQQRLEALAELGLDMQEVGRELQGELLSAARESWRGLHQAVAEKRRLLSAGWKPLAVAAASLEPAADRALGEMQAFRIPQRIWAADHTVWKPDPTEIADRLGWLRAGSMMRAQIERLRGLAVAFRADGYTRVVLLGMGGSSLAPETLLRTFGAREGYPELRVLDTTDPAAVHGLAKDLDLERTAFIVSSKSGTTQETLSLFKFFYRRAVAALGEWRAGEHFLAITDPGTPLAGLAERLHLRGALLNDPNLGGRYSALSFFGLAPAAVIGLDLPLLLERAEQAASASERWVPAADNPAARLGALLAEAARQGRDKLTLLTPPAIHSFGDWAEQLIAESTGKQGAGILPVVGERPGPPEVYGDDRLFVALWLDERVGESAGPGADGLGAPGGPGQPEPALLDQLGAAGHPTIELRLRDRYDLGAQFFWWEMAIAVAGHRLGINPFDQPDVEAAKAQARRIVQLRRSQAEIPAEQPAVTEGGLALYGLSTAHPAPASSFRAGLDAFLDGARPGGYLALQAYLNPAPDIREGLAALRQALRSRTRLAVTQGIGPRYLHSTGQLHKGDAGKGLFLQLTAADPLDLDIPDEPDTDASSLTFGALKAAQAEGDRQALLQGGRAVIRIDLGEDPAAGLARLGEMLV
jgi:transaldolase/glucose-6-phosphate isomerase